MKIYMTISFLFLFLFFSCAEKDMILEPPLPEGSIHFEVEGQKYEWSNASAKSVFYNVNPDNYSIAIEAESIQPVDRYDEILLLVFDSTGTYKLGIYETSGADFESAKGITLLLGSSDSNERYSNHEYLTNARVDFSILEFKEKGLLRGIFSAKLLEKNTKKIIEIANGQFNVRLF